MSVFHSCMVPLRRERQLSTPPLFCVHGQPLAIAKALKKERNTYSLHSAYAVKDAADAPSTVEEIARDYVASMHRKFPSGPYYLYGFCTGAMIAYEMARQLEAGGFTVAHLCMASPAVGGKRSVERVREQYGASTGQLLSVDALLAVARLCRKAFRMLPALAKIKFGTWWRRVLRVEMPLDLLHENILFHLAPSIRTYRYRPLKCAHIDVIYGDADEEFERDATEFWSVTTGSPVVVQRVPGVTDHLHLLSNNEAVGLSAKVLDRSFD